MFRYLAGLLLFCATMSAGETTWRGLVVAPENRCAPYDRDDYRYPQSVEDEIIAKLGDLFSPYTCAQFGSSRETEIEHMIAVSQAHDSGLCMADRQTKRRFASDLRNLTLAAPAVNREKGARDAAEWLPETNRCWFAGRIVEVRRAYELTIDRREAAALESVLSNCSPADVGGAFCASRSFVMQVLLPILETDVPDAGEATQVP
ncbi:MAG: hypothetical protein OXP28_07195 [Gammaproteobacteria bacterium]|nr:hypothetical protein [Gammaproteobacteria bacterium]MDE0224903.1 hypothetical protein [Gammaproteobacteria bacterium]MDE0452998.1 hypothetical protein [Gammaproteobacteria bacterium]